MDELRDLSAMNVNKQAIIAIYRGKNDFLNASDLPGDVEFLSRVENWDGIVYNPINPSSL